MGKRVRVGLLWMIVVAVSVALLGTEANAQIKCAKPPCAKTYWYSGACICCTTGSEVFNITATGVPGWFVKNCPDPEGCLQCSVYGTADVGLGCDPTRPDDRCGVEGVLFCVNHGGNSDTAQGQPFTFDAVLTGAGGFSNCTKAGKCTSQITVTGGQLPDVCINPNWDPYAFTASKFNGTCCSCAGGYDKEDKCCADGTRDSLGLCIPPLGTETCTEEGFRCSIGEVPKPGDRQSYQCCLLSELVFTVAHPEGVCPQSL